MKPPPNNFPVSATVCVPTDSGYFGFLHIKYSLKNVLLCKCQTLFDKMLWVSISNATKKDKTAATVATH